MNAYYFIFAYLDKNIERELVAISDDLAVHFENIWGQFDDKLFRPHISLYHSLFSGEKELDIIDKFQSLKVSKISIQLGDLHVQPDGHCVLNCIQNGNKLKGIHKLLLQKFQLLRSQTLQVKYLQNMYKYSPMQQRMLKLHGNPHFGSLFNPQITLNKVIFSTRQIKAYIRAMHSMKYTMNIKNLTLIKSSVFNVSDDPRSAVISNLKLL